MSLVIRGCGPRARDFVPPCFGSSRGVWVQSWVQVVCELRPRIPAPVEPPTGVSSVIVRVAVVVVVRVLIILMRQVLVVVAVLPCGVIGVAIVAPIARQAEFVRPLTGIAAGGLVIILGLHRDHDTDDQRRCNQRSNHGRAPSRKHSFRNRSTVCRSHEPNAHLRCSSSTVDSYKAAFRVRRQA